MFTGAGPGRGGVSRGPGSAPLDFGAETPFESDDFEAKRLDSAQLEDLDRTDVLGIGSTAPTVVGAGEATGQRALGADSGKAAWRRRLAPRHRRAVGTFFGGQ